MKIIFVIGTGRSGTGILSNMIACHPDVTNCGESHFLPTLMYTYKDAAFEQMVDIIYDHQDSDGNAHGWQRNYDLASSLQRDCSFDADDIVAKPRLLESFYNKLHGYSDIYIDKTPYYGLMAKDIEDEFGADNVKFIHIIRDKDDTIASMQKHSGLCKMIRKGLFQSGEASPLYASVLKDIDGSPVTYEEAAKYYDDTLKGIQYQAEFLRGNYCEVRYERLIKEPQFIFGNIAKFLNLETWTDRAVKLIK